MTVTGLTGTEYQLLAKPFSSGGEGEIYRVAGDTEKRIAKIYHKNAIIPELEEKLKIMVNNHPGTQVKSQVAWPLDVVYNNNSFCGFIMPELDINTELGSIYRYPSDLNISCKQKITIAKNICAVISAVHKAGYVFGDFNPRNIGVDKNIGKVAFLDTDTYHVTEAKSQKVYRCNVCAPGYAAPELLEKCADHVSSYPNDSKNTYSKAPLPTFTKETDNFALAIHIFKLLNNGYTPFGGIPETASASQASPGTGDDAVRRDSYCFKDGNKPQSVAIPPISVFPQELAKLFTRAFVIGRKDPSQRPSSLEWHDVLTKYEETLVNCKKNPLHQYDPKNSDCPWCKADEQYQDSIRQIPDQEEYTTTPVSLPPPIKTDVTEPITYSPDEKTDVEGNRFYDSQYAEGTLKKFDGERFAFYYPSNYQIIFDFLKKNADQRITIQPTGITTFSMDIYRYLDKSETPQNFIMNLVDTKTVGFLRRPKFGNFYNTTFGGINCLAVDGRTGGIGTLIDINYVFNYHNDLYYICMQGGVNNREAILNKFEIIENSFEFIQKKLSLQSGRKFNWEGLSVTYPNDWNVEYKIDRDDFESFQVDLTHPDQDSPDSVNICWANTDVFSIAADTLKVKMLDSLIDNLKINTENLKYGSYYETTFNKLDCISVDYSANYPHLVFLKAGASGILSSFVMNDNLVWILRQSNRKENLSNIGFQLIEQTLDIRR